jgi:methionyl-tRNA formyltransferase
MEYRYSALNSRPEEVKPLGAAAIDLNDDQCVSDLKESYHLILSFNCKQIFPADLVSSVTCKNVHPGFNPYNRGWFP